MCLYDETQADPDNTQDDWCDTDADCGPGLCCGLATSYDEDGFEMGKLSVCNDKTSSEWMDHMDYQTFYSFHCAATQGALKIGASLAASASILYMMA